MLPAQSHPRPSSTSNNISAQGLNRMQALLNSFFTFFFLFFLLLGAALFSPLCLFLCGFFFLHVLPFAFFISFFILFYQECRKVQASNISCSIQTNETQDSNPKDQRQHDVQASKSSYPKPKRVCQGRIQIECKLPILSLLLHVLLPISYFFSF